MNFATEQAICALLHWQRNTRAARHARRHGHKNIAAWFLAAAAENRRAYAAWMNKAGSAAA